MMSPALPACDAPAPRPLKILHTEAATGLGGQEIYIFRHMQAMRARGHEVALLCQPHARLATLCRAHGFVVHTLAMGGPWRLLRGIWQTRRLLLRERYDVVNTTSRRDTLIAAAAARLAGVPLVVRSRHLMSPVNSLLTYTGLPHRVITVSRFVSDLLHRRGVPRRRIGVVPPIAELPRWHTGDAPATRAELAAARDQGRATLGLRADDIVVGCVAVLRRAKGHADLVRAIAPLCRANPRLQLVIIGDGEPVTGELKQLRRALGIEAQVHLPGYRFGACALMPAFDVFALASHKEAAGTVLLEAALAGVPIVATRVGGIPEMVEEGRNALLVRAHDITALRSALQRLCEDAPLREAMGAAGLLWAGQASQFTADGHGRLTEGYYRNWLGELAHG